MRTPHPVLLAAVVLLLAAATAPIAAGESDILVLTSAELEPGLARWKKHREAQGHRVSVALLAHAVASDAARRTQETLLERIRKERPRVVLIAGNVAHVPAFAFTSARLGKTCESDQPWGLPDPATGMPALQVGRIPAADPPALEAALAKVIRYETTFTPGEARNTIHFLGSPAGFGPAVDATIEAVATRLLARELDQHYHLEVLYASPSSPFFLPQAEFPARTRAAFEAGPLLVVFAGHGNARSFAHIRHRGISRYFGVEDTAGLRCRSHSLFFSITCLTGDFEHADRPGLCAQLMLEPGGPAATFGSSEISEPLANLLIDQALLAQVANARHPTLGDALAALRADFQERTSSIGSLVDRWMQGKTDEAALKEHHQHLYNLFGDPAMRLRFPRQNLELAARREGAALVLEGTSPTVREGTALIRYEVDRGKLMGRLEPHADKPPAEAARILRKNHEIASNKTLFRHEVPIRNGTFRLALDHAAATPRRIAGRPQWEFFFRVYAWNEHEDAVGSLRYEPADEPKPPAQ
ncbi:MAG: hypothetical protein JXQ29_17400 [Planctomycetes bacterium]|nr:hypothetical protein [Planctomycetota bacterium]